MVITDSIERVDGGAILTRGAAGERRHEVDTIITAIEQGRNHAIDPGFASGYRWRTRRFDPAPHVLEHAGRDGEAVAA